VELEGKILSIKLYSSSKWKNIVRYILYFITFGVAYLFCRWFPKLYIKLALTLATIQKAEWVMVLGGGKQYL